MLRPDVILVGASVRSLAESVIRDGKVPFCVDYFGDADLRFRLQQIAASENICTINDWSEVADAISTLDPNIPIILVGGAEADADLANRLSSSRNVVGPARDSIRQLRDPEIVFPALREFGCLVPEWSIGDGKGLDSSTAKEWLVKDRDSSGGQSVRNAAKASGLSSSEYLQKRIDGPCFSATFLASSGESNGAALLGVALQLSGCESLNSNGFQFCGNAGPIELAEDLKTSLLSVARKLVGRFGMTGVFGMDFILHQDQPWAIEVNPRITASHEIHELAGSPSHVSLQLGSTRSPANTCTANTLASTTTNKQVRLVVYASETITVTEAIQRKLMQFLALKPNKRPSVWVADVPISGALINNGTPLCSVYLQLATFNNEDLRHVCQHIPADTSNIEAHMIDEIQDQIHLLEKVNNFLN